MTNKNTEQEYWGKSLHNFVQRLLVPSFKQQVAKPQVLMKSQQNCSKQDRQYWTECTEYVAIWETGVARGMDALHVHPTSQER